MCGAHAQLVRGCAHMCMGVRPGIHGCVHDCAWVYSGLLLENIVLASADFDTYAIRLFLFSNQIHFNVNYDDIRACVCRLLDLKIIIFSCLFVTQIN